MATSFVVLVLYLLVLYYLGKFTDRQLFGKS
jgi:hypothetical protein